MQAKLYSHASFVLVYNLGIQVTWLNFSSSHLATIDDLRHQSSAMCVIMLGREDTHPWYATKGGNPTIPATIPVVTRKPTNSMRSHTFINAQEQKITLLNQNI